MLDRRDKNRANSRSGSDPDSVPTTDSSATRGYDGQLLSGSLLDYALPRASWLPDIELDETVTPSPVNPLGVKGVGEAGTTASIAAVMNAIANAIPDGRGVNIDMPATPAKIWRACHPPA